MPQPLAALVPNVWYVTWPAGIQLGTRLCSALVLMSLQRQCCFLPTPAGWFLALLCSLVDWQARRSLTTFWGLTGNHENPITFSLILGELGGALWVLMLTTPLLSPCLLLNLHFGWHQRQCCHQTTWGRLWPHSSPRCRWGIGHHFTSSLPTAAFFRGPSASHFSSWRPPSQGLVWAFTWMWDWDSLSFETESSSIELGATEYSLCCPQPGAVSMKSTTSTHS